MSLAIVLTDEAQAEFDTAVDWYDQVSGPAAEFIIRVRETLIQIGQMPELHVLVRDDIRRALVRQFPYSIFYRVRPDRIEVIAVFHNQRDPSEWHRRA